PHSVGTRTSAPGQLCPKRPAVILSALFFPGARLSRAQCSPLTMALSPLFWLIALALLVATMTVLVLPLLRRAAGVEPPAAQSAAIAVFRDHKRQIDADFAAGTITTAERDTALDDLTARFGHELALQTPEPSASGDRPRLIAAFVLVACVPVVAGVLYFALGNPVAMTATPAATAESSITDPQIIAMVEGLAKRLQDKPDDGEGWLMLARSYRALGRLDASALAYAQAAKRLPANADVYADWAETVAQTQRSEERRVGKECRSRWSP